MSMPESVLNEGNFFNDEALHGLIGELDAEEAAHRDSYEQIKEHYERRRAQLVDGLSHDEVGFFLLGRVLHVLGFTHSHGEALPQEMGRIDYTLFENADDFISRIESRGTSQFFTGALGAVKLIGWDKPLDPQPTEEESNPEHPAFALDDIMRQTGLQWGFLSNGRHWRLYHRNTVGMLNTYFQIDLIEILETSDFGAFKFFSGVFGKAALSPDATGSAPIRGLLS